MCPSTRSASPASYLFIFLYQKENKWRTRSPTEHKICHHTPKKKYSKKYFRCMYKLHACNSRDVFSAYNCKLFPKWSCEGGGGGRRGGGRRPVLPRYFSPFVNNGDVNCRRFDRAFERAVTTATVTFTRDVSRSLRLPPFKTLMNGTSCRVEEKRETWVIQGNMDKHSVRIELSFEGGPVLGLPLFGRVNFLRERGYAKETP